MFGKSFINSFFLLLIAKSLMKAFSNYTVKQSLVALNGNSFTFLTGFGMIIDFNTSYYVLDSTLIFFLNDAFEYVTLIIYV
jgi:hypothetical protein